MYLKREMVCVKPHAQYTSKFERTVCATENSTEWRNALSNTFHNAMEKRNPHQSQSQRRRRRRFLLRCTIYHICQGQ